MEKEGFEETGAGTDGEGKVWWRGEDAVEEGEEGEGEGGAGGWVSRGGGG